MNGTSFHTLIFYILFSLSTGNSETSCSNEEQCSEKHNKYSKGMKVFKLLSKSMRSFAVIRIELYETSLLDIKLFWISVI